MNKTKQFLNHEQGVTTVEYAVMLALIAITCIAAIIAVGSIASLFWNDSADGIGNALNN